MTKRRSAVTGSPPRAAAHPTFFRLPMSESAGHFRGDRGGDYRGQQASNITLPAADIGHIAYAFHC